MALYFSHKGLKSLYLDGNHAGVNPQHAKKILRILSKLKTTKESCDMNVPGWGLHQLKGDLSGYWSVTIETNWRIIFRFIDDDIVDINCIDYH